MFAVLGLCFALVQFTATWYQWSALSWGKGRWGYGIALSLGGVSGGYILLLGQTSFMMGVIVAMPLAIILSFVGGTYLASLPHPETMFTTPHPCHVGCNYITIPHDETYHIPGVLLTPHQWQGQAVILIPGAGDNKTGFKWRLVQSLLQQGLLVLSLDPPGHGDYFDRPLGLTNAISCVITGVQYLQQYEGIKRIGILGFSLGGAIAVRALAENPHCQVEALAVMATPTHLTLTRRLIVQEIWHTSRAPILSLWGEMTLRHFHQSWQKGRYNSTHSVSDLIALLDLPRHLPQVGRRLPTLLVYSDHDVIAPLTTGEFLHQLAPETTLIKISKASHVTITLIHEATDSVAEWFAHQLR